MEITPILCLVDNYAYIIYDNETKTVGVVDPSEALPIVAFLEKKNTKQKLFVLKATNTGSLESIKLLKIAKNGPLVIH